MSDDFDKEAEREKLREKLEAEEEDREQTQRMSELLLQGATMTNRHCETCGSPLFRQNGREFCPTCGAEAVDNGNGEGASGGTDGRTAEADPAGHAARPDAPEADAPSDADTDPSRTGSADGPSPPETARTPANGADAQPRNESAPATPAGTGTDSRPSSQSPGPAGRQDDDLTAAKRSLARQVRSLAEAAAEAEDLGRARELLAATQEAAEALGAVESARR